MKTIHILSHLWIALAVVLIIGSAWCDETLRIQPSRHTQFYDVYRDNHKGNRPTFVTSDSLLHTAHILFDYTLRAAEIRHLNNQLLKLLRPLEADFRRTAQAHEGKQFFAAVPHVEVKRNLALVSVALSLLEPAFKPTAQVAAGVDAELKLIHAHAGLADSPTMGIREDYSQYVPRGHYTRNPVFERFFRAMMWLGRMGYPLSGEKAPGIPLTEAEKESYAISALLFARALHETCVDGGEGLVAMTVWESIYHPTRFFVGSSDDLTPPEVFQLGQSVFGDAYPGVNLRPSEAQLKDFIKRAQTLRKPLILSSPISDQSETPVQFRFMGQRFIPDSYVLGQMVYSHVGTRDRPRCLPSGLDVMAALGSPLARKVLREKTDAFSFANYEKQLDRMTQWFASQTPKQWQTNLYWGWLWALQSLLEPATGQNLPSIFRTEKWGLKQLQAALGSWAELRHDTILYAKQSFTVGATAMPPPPELTKGSVEPVPETMKRIRLLMTAMREGLGKAKVFPEELRANVDNFVALLADLEPVAEATRQAGERGVDLTEDQWNLIWTIGARLRDIESIPEPLKSEVAGTADNDAALIADVHTDINTKQTLEVGVGRVHVLAIAVPVDGKTVVAYGPVFSYYEFPHPMSQRLTDEKWQEMLNTRKAPSQPAWLQPLYQ